VETSDYGIQGNRNSGSIGVCFRSCGDECLRLQRDQLLEFGSDSGGDSGSDSGGDSRGDSRDYSDNSSCSESEYGGSLCDFVGKLVLGHQLQ